jgi:prolyl-tRNA editing enzyme YbaK/EbsC (Cys-tRNA(Pro) deacylase)
MLDEYISVNGLNAQIMHFNEEVANSRQSAQVGGSFPGIKTILFAHEKGFVLAIVEGSAKVDTQAIARILETKNVRLATPPEVENVTGYEAGGVPPISIYGTPTLIDVEVTKHAWVIAGGGDKFSLLKIQTRDILEHAFEARVEKISR